MDGPGNETGQAWQQAGDGTAPPGYSPPPGYGGYGQYTGYGQYGGYGQYSGAYGRPAAPKPGIIPLRPLNLGEILDGAFTAIRWNPKTILMASAIVAAVGGVITAAATLAVQHEFLANVTIPTNGQVLNSGQLASLAGAFAGLGGVAVIVAVLAHSILTGLITVIVGQGVLGRKETLRTAWRATRSRFGALIAVVLLWALFTAGGWAVATGISVGIGVALAAAHQVAVGILIGVLGTLTATVFAVITAVRWSLAVPVVMLERLGPVTSLRRSWRLVKRSSWRVLGATVLTQVIVSIANMVFQLPFQLAGVGGILSLTQGSTAAHASLGATILSGIGGIISSTLTAPLAAGVVVLLYADLRMRREGLDITLQAAAANGEPAVGGTGPDGQNLGPW